MLFGDFDWEPDETKLSQFGRAGAAIFLGLACLAWRRGHAGEAAILGVLGSYCGLAWFLSPGWLRPLHLLLTGIGYPIGATVSFCVMAVLYYGMLAPMGIVSRWMGHDALGLRFDRQAKTYWTPRGAPADPERYFRQY